MRPDLDELAARIDEYVAKGLDPFTALVDAERDCRPAQREGAASVQLSMDLRG